MGLLGHNPIVSGWASLLFPISKVNVEDRNNCFLFELQERKSKQSRQVRWLISGHWTLIKSTVGKTSRLLLFCIHNSTSQILSKKKKNIMCYLLKKMCFLCERKGYPGPYQLNVSNHNKNFSFQILSLLVHSLVLVCILSKIPN